MRPYTRMLIGLLGALVPATVTAQNELLTYRLDTTLAGESSHARAIAFAADGSLLAIGGTRGAVTVYNTRNRQQVVGFTTRGDVTALAFSRDSRWVVAGTSDKLVVLFDLQSHQKRELSGHRGRVTTVAVSLVNDVFASGGTDHSIIFWSLPDGNEIGRLTDAHGKDVEYLKFGGPHGETLISVGADRQIVYWDVKNKTRLRQSTEPDAYLPSATASAAGEWLILGTEMTQLPGFRGGLGVNRGGLVYQDRVKFYNSETGMAGKVIENLTAEPRRVSLSADNKVIAVAQSDSKRNFVALWDVDRGVQFAEIPASKEVTDVAFSPDGKWLAYGDEAAGVKLLAVTGITPRLAVTASLQGRKYTVTSPRTPLVRPARRMRFAVLDLDDNGVGTDVTHAIADQLANRLASNPAVRLVERRRISTLLKEQQFQHSGRTETDGAVRMARILNVQKVIMGAVAKLGTTMTITAQLVDVESAQIDGVREMQCQACSLEDLPEAIAEMSETLVAPPEDTVSYPAEPPHIEIQSPRDGDSTATNHAIIRGVVQYSRALEGVELVVNGEPYTASRALEPSQAKLTRLAGGTKDFAFVQNIPLREDNNVVAIRAVGTDGNDEQRYVMIHRIARARPATPEELSSDRAPTLSIREVEGALLNHVPLTRVRALVAEFGVDFAVTSDIEQRLRTAGADAALVAAVRRAKR